MHAVDITPEMKRSVLVEGQPMFSRVDAGSVIKLAKGVTIPSARDYYGLSSAINTQANTYFHIDQDAEITYRSIIPYGNNIYLWSSLGNNEYIVEQKIRISNANRQKITNLFNSFGDIYKSLVNDAGLGQDWDGQRRGSFLLEYFRGEGIRNAGGLFGDHTERTNGTSDNTRNANEDGRGGIDEKEQLNTDDNKQPLRTSNGTVYGWSQGDTIYLTPEGINPNTPIHEYAHLWSKAVQKNNPELWSNINNDIAKTRDKLNKTDQRNEKELEKLDAELDEHLAELDKYNTILDELKAQMPKAEEKKEETHNRHATVNQSAETNDESLDKEQNGTPTPTSMNSPTPSEGKDNSSESEKQEQTITINGEEYKISDIEDDVLAHVNDILAEAEIDAEIVGVKVIGSRANGTEREDSDLDVLVEFKGAAREDTLFNLFNEEPMTIGGVIVDINPITKGKSGTIEQFMKRNAGYVKEEEPTDNEPEPTKPKSKPSKKAKTEGKSSKNKEAELKNEVPEWTEDTSSKARERGYRMRGNERVNRQGNVKAEVGSDTEIIFSNKDKVKGKFAVIDASELQPSHIGGNVNINHFIPEAQPKERTDKASTTRASQIAQNIDPSQVTQGVTAYVGTPVINTRGEVIQGNNRSAALKESHEIGKADNYKQYLKDHAQEFGLTAEQIDNIKSPVLVRIADVTDEEAIRLGQMSSQDTESGGVERIDAKKTAKKLGSNFGSIVQNMLVSEDETATLKETIRANARDIADRLRAQNAISDTQYQSAFRDNGEPTKEFVEDCENLLLEHIFNGTPDNTRALFNTLPSKAQNAIASAMWRDALLPEEKQLKDFVVESIFAFDTMKRIDAFNNAKTLEEARAVINDMNRQTSIFDNKTDGEKFSDTAKYLAGRYKVNTQKELKTLFGDYYGAVGEGNSLFGNDSKSRDEAISVAEFSQAVAEPYTEIDSEEARIATEEVMRIANEQPNINVEVVSQEEAQRFAEGAERQETTMSDTFYSNAANAVRNIKQDKATPEQWLAMIQKNGGLKAEEDKWLGLSDWLNSKSGSVTKHDILDYIAGNSVRIEDVEYGGNNESYFALQDHLKEQIKEGLDIGNYDILEQVLHKYDWDNNTDFLYELQRPKSRFDIDEDGNITIDGEKLKKGGKGINSTRLDYTTKGLENKREIALIVPTIEPYNESDGIHFGDAGEGRAVVWVRFGETTDTEGKRVLVIDEIQSKRHQDGREKGYRKSFDEQIADLGYTLEKEAKHWVIRDKDGYSKGSVLITMAPTEADAKRLLSGTLYSLNSKNSVPDAPFQKNWHELAMKRMLRLAAEEGFDKIAWTTGAQQAERYNIGKAIDEVWCGSDSNQSEKRFNFQKDGNSIGSVKVSEDGNIIIGNGFFEDAEGKSLDEVVGKELATQLMGIEPNEKIDLKNNTIGGEGMKGFYDQMLPKFMDKYGKKWGAKVGEVELELPNEADRRMWSVDVTPEMKRSVLVEGQPMFQRSNASDNLTSSRLKTLGDGEFAAVERIFERDKSFSFTSGKKIKTIDDVAYIFKQLENSAVENSFVCLVKKGKPTVIHLGMGGYTQTVVEVRVIDEAVRRTNPDHVFFVHNHPSGSLKPSNVDKRCVEEIKRAIPNVGLTNIIIDTYSGKYSVFDNDGEYDDSYTQKDGDVANDMKVNVYAFSKQAYNKDYKPSEQLMSATDVAEFITSHRLGERDKISALILSNDNRCVGNVFLPDIDLSNTVKIAEYIAGAVNTFGGVRCVLYGRYDLSNSETSKLSAVLNNKGLGIVDALSFSEDGSHVSAYERGMLGEDNPMFSRVEAGSVIKLAKGVTIPSARDYYGLSSAINTQANTYFHIDQDAEITYRSIIPYGNNIYLWSSLGNNEYIVEQKIRISNANRQKIVRLYHSFGDVYGPIINTIDSGQNRTTEERYSIIYEYFKGEGLRVADRVHSEYDKTEIRTSNNTRNADENGRGGVDEKEQVNTGDNKQPLRTSNGTVYGWSQGNTIYLTPEGINPNTPIHEYAHLWSKAVQKNNPELWSNITTLARMRVKSLNSVNMPLIFLTSKPLAA